MAMQKSVWQAARSNPYGSDKEKINMANNILQQVGCHAYKDALAVQMVSVKYKLAPEFTYTFANFFHPFVGKLIAKLNRDSLPRMLAGQLDPALRQDFFKDFYNPNPANDNLIRIEYSPKEIDVTDHGPYANYNWELFFHIPLMIAVHLSKNQRFAEAQRWFHYIFNPTSNDHTVDPPQRFWNFLAFRKPDNSKTLDEIVRILSIPRSELSPDDQLLQDDILNGYTAILNKPFQPHAVARTRHVAYQYDVVMKYLDNLIAWGDSLFQQDTIESINEATQIYVLAANILGERPQQIPPLGKAEPKTFAQLKKGGLGPIGDALVALEGQFPFNLTNPNSATGGNGAGDSSALFGIGRTLYFCLPKNDKLLGYWDTVADRLFKIRHCMNIAGVVRPLALFDPPIDPGMLVKAAAAGIDIGSIVSGLNQPIGPVRCLFLIQKALELCAEVRGLGNALLSALEKGDAEHLALIRQRHDIQIQQMAQEVRFLQWKQAQENTTSLLTNRKTALERLKYYKRLLNIPNDPNAPDDLPIDHSEKADDTPKLTQENFDEVYSALVGQYDKQLTHYDLPKYTPVGGDSPTQQAGASGQGRLFLNTHEDVDLNKHSDLALAAHLSASGAEAIAAVLGALPSFEVEGHFWGVGVKSKLVSGDMFSNIGRAVSSGFNIWAQVEEYQGRNASKTSSYERRADDWLLQYNLAARELMQIGRQILTSLIAEQIAHHEYLSIKQQIANAQEVDQFLHDKFTNEDLYLWMQGEISRLYYEYYRFAFDTARKAEKTMKQELMRPELDAQDFVKFNYWDAGRKGLLSGEALYLDVKRMEMAYHDNNKRELELTKNVSLRQLNPLALLALKATGTCQVTVPEWLFDLDGPGHYMRRIKIVALSIPSVVGPYTSVNCTLSLLKSSVRKTPIASDDYARQGTEDDRFVDYIGAVQSIVTSNAQNDSGMFEANLREDRFLPFEGAGTISTWKLDLPKDYRAFDYDTISDVILHIRYTARQGVDPTKVKTALDDLFRQANQAGLALLFSLRHDFPTEWAAFVSGTGNFTATIRKDYFPCFTQSQSITITGFDLYGQNVTKHHSVGDQAAWDAATADLGDKNKQAFTVTIPPDGPGPTQVLTRTADADAFLIVRYSLD
jgi:hypothetical protein